MTPDESVVEYASNAAPGCRRDRVLGVRRLNAGENHLAYVVTYDDLDNQQQVVVRIATSERARDEEAAGREAAVLAAVQGVAAPHLHDFRLASEWFGAPVMCLSFVAGEQRLPRDAPDFERLGRALARVHALRVEDLAERWGDPGTLDGYVSGRLAEFTDRVAAVVPSMPTPVQNRLVRAVDRVAARVGSARASTTFRTTESLSLLHGDPAGANLIWTPEPVLIDWEYARLGDPADEIAYVFTQHGCREEQRSAFWCGYRSTPDPRRPVAPVAARVDEWEPLALLGSAVFWVEQWSRRLHRQPLHQRDQALHRLSQLESLLWA